LPFVERDPLSLAQILEAHAFYVGHVEKDVVARRGFDEPEAPVCESLDCTFGHFVFVLPEIIGAPVARRRCGSEGEDHPENGFLAQIPSNVTESRPQYA
jgi:hypothetical protein